MAPEDSTQTVPLHTEELAVSRRLVEAAVVRVETRTSTTEHVVDEELAHATVEIERVPIGRYVDAAPPIIESEEATIIPVMREVLVVERRLFLKEEVHIRKVRKTTRHVETVQLRDQEALITRTPAS